MTGPRDFSTWMHRVGGTHLNDIGWLLPLTSSVNVTFFIMRKKKIILYHTTGRKRPYKFGFFNWEIVPFTTKSYFIGY